MFYIFQFTSGWTSIEHMYVVVTLIIFVDIQLYITPTLEQEVTQSLLLLHRQGSYYHREPMAHY